jgi:plastocyanin
VSATILSTACAGDDAYGQTQSVEVSAKEMHFTPSAITLAPGRRTIVVHNRGTLTHTFSLNALGREVTVAPGKTKTLTLDLHPGKFRYVCRILDHEGLGMHGALQVRTSS